MTIGDGTFLNDAQFGGADCIAVGPKSILASVAIMDTNFHASEVDRHGGAAQVKTAQVRLGANVWIAARAAVLRQLE